MISDEVRMLSNRMLSNPEEFITRDLEFGDRYEVRETRNWDKLMNSIVNNKPDLACMFTQEEIDHLRATVYEILRPKALGTIVKKIVGGKDDGEYEQKQMEMSYTHPYGTSTITQADILRMKATGTALREIIDEKAKRGLTP